MTDYDVLIVGGGPAGSTAARHLVASGARVAVVDRAVFPRDKVCAGWITPPVVELLGLDLDEYARSNTLQPFTGFDTAAFSGGGRPTDFDHVVSYGIRRIEFDNYLLARSGAERVMGEAADIRREAGQWIVNGRLRAPMLIGAGGHFCPVARLLNGPDSPESTVAAQEIEYRLDGDASRACPVDAKRPVLLFWPDLCGYGWCVRKGEYLNVGVGRLSAKAFPAEVRKFLAEVERRQLLPGRVPGRFKGHAYLVNRTSRRTVVGDGVMLVGDAAGLALAPSGEGILSGVESGLLAARAVTATATSADALTSYVEAIDTRFGPRGESGWMGRIPKSVAAMAGWLLLQSPRLTRRVLIEDAFLHTRRARLA